MQEAGRSTCSAREAVLQRSVPRHGRSRRGGSLLLACRQLPGLRCSFEEKAIMRDYLAWRLAFGVTTPSTNTVVQPEYDDMRPPGVTNHLARMVIPDMAIRTNEDFDESIRLIDAALEDAVDGVMDCKP